MPGLEQPHDGGPVDEPTAPGPARLRRSAARSKLLASTFIRKTAMTDPDAATPGPSGSTFKTTLIRVIVVQVIALAALALLQLRYTAF